MATHSSILAWKIPWTEEPVDYSPWGRKESDMTEQLCIHRRVIAFLPRSKRLLISWLQSASSVILEPKKIKAAIVSITYHSVQFSRSVVSDSSRPHESQHARPPCPSPNPRVHSKSCPSSR